MPYNTKLANRIRAYLAEVPHLEIEEKEMFRGLTFMVNGKMCISVSGENLMCRFDPTLQDEIAEKKGYQPMIMKGREYKDYCYIAPSGASVPSGSLVTFFAFAGPSNLAYFLILFRPPQRGLRPAATPNTNHPFWRKCSAGSLVTCNENQSALQIASDLAATTPA